MKCEHEVQIFLNIVKSDERAKLAVSSGIMMICFHYRHGLPKGMLTYRYSERERESEAGSLSTFFGPTHKAKII